MKGKFRGYRYLLKKSDGFVYFCLVGVRLLRVYEVICVNIGYNRKVFIELFNVDIWEFFIFLFYIVKQ